MPIKSKREYICQRCGKKFIVETGDAITFDDLKKMNQKYCIKCRIIKRFLIKGE